MNAPVTTRRMRRSNFWYLLAGAILLIAAGVSLHVHRLLQADASPPPEHAPWALQTGVVERGSVASSIESVAVVEAPQEIVLSPQIQGIALAVGPRAGIAVKRGQVLVRIDARAIRHDIAALAQQRAAARADADYATKQLSRVDAVLAEGGVSQAQADQARTAAEGARARAHALTEQLAALQVNLGYAEIRAPQDAVVAERMAEVGDTVGPGKPVYRLTAGRGAVVRVSLPAAQLAQIHAGDTLQLHDGRATVALRISRIAPAVNGAGLGTAEADAPVAPFGLPSGSTVAAAVRRAGSSEMLTVPVASLVGSGSEARVAVFMPDRQAGQPGRLRIVPVQVVQEGVNRAAVRGALAAGEQVVVGQTAVLARLRNGDAAVTMAGMGAAQ